MPSASPALQVVAPDAAAAPVALRLGDIRKVYLGHSGAVVEALAGITLDVRQGEVVAIVGPSGCGKSSLLRILAGLDADYDGRLDWSLAADEAAPGRRLQSATVFQSDSTFPWLTVERNLVVGLSGLNLDRGEAAARIRKYLSLVGLGGFHAAYPHELSGGMRQRVAIARALATEPLLLLMDEPLASLDAQTRLIMQQELLRIWKETRSTVIYITHDIGEALTLAHRTVIMTARPGRIKAVKAAPARSHDDVVDLRRQPEFGQLEAEVWHMVAEEVGHSLAAERRDS